MKYHDKFLQKKYGTGEKEEPKSSNYANNTLNDPGFKKNQEILERS